MWGIWLRRMGEIAIAIVRTLTQKSTNNSANAKDHVYCRHVAVELKRLAVAQLFEILRKNGCLKCTTVITGNASDASPSQFLLPCMACAMTEDFQDNGKHAVIVKQVVAYRRRSQQAVAFLGGVFLFVLPFIGADREDGRFGTSGAQQVGALPSRHGPPRGGR
jgi:F0F1-type ATP synthase alpha subunit